MILTMNSERPKTMPNRKAAVVDYFDDYNPDSYLLCLEPYNLKLLQALAKTRDVTEIVVYGEAEDVDRFVEDNEEGTLEPMESVSKGLEFDEDYEMWLNNEVNRMLDLIEAERKA